MNFELNIWVIYDHPTDYPDTYVARRWVGEKPTDDILLSPDLEAVENQLAEWGLTMIGRYSEDDPKIMSVWL